MCYSPHETGLGKPDEQTSQPNFVIWFALTLSNRLRGVTQSRSRAFTHRQALSHDEEASLVE